MFAVLDFFSSIIDFIVGFFESIVSLITMLVEGSQVLFSVIEFMPVQYKAVLIALVSYCLLVVILHQGADN